MSKDEVGYFVDSKIGTSDSIIKFFYKAKSLTRRYDRFCGCLRIYLLGEKVNEELMNNVK